MGRTGFVFCEEMLTHDPGLMHPERPARLRAIVDAVGRSGLAVEHLGAGPAGDAELLRVHDPAHLEGVGREVARVTPPGASRRLRHAHIAPDTLTNARSWEASLWAAGAAVSAARAVAEGVVDRAFCAVRPPGHHAERDYAMGFCLLNNAAIAVRWLQEAAGVGKVAIVDWDVHHGNGTQQAFYNDPSVYYASIHQWPLYPGTGREADRGANGTNLNVPVRPGADPEVWIEALRARILPELERFHPDFLVISAGFDAHRLDPLGQQMLESASYYEMTKALADLAGGRAVSLLEGGYHTEALAESVVAHLTAMGEWA